MNGFSPMILLPPSRPMASEVVDSFEPDDQKLRAVITLSAGGHSLLEISRVTGLSIKQVSTHLQRPESKAEMMKVLAELDVGNAEKRMLGAAAMDAVMVLQEIMHKGQKDSDRLSAAKEILNRTLGTPTQKIQTDFNANGSVDALEEIQRLKTQLKLQPQTKDDSQPA